MSDRVREALERLEAALVARGNPEVDGLLPGITEDEVRTRLAELGIDPPQDLVTLFGWHNGCGNPDGQPWSGWIVTSTKLLTLDEACELFAQLRGGFEALAEMGGTDGVEWFPVIDLEGWETIVMDCRPNSPTRGSVGISDGGDIRESEHRRATLAEPVELWASYVETGLWRWGPPPAGAGWVDYRDESQVAAHPLSI